MTTPLILLTVVVEFLALGTPREQVVLDLDRRIAVRETIARVQYAHQEQATQPFEQAVPRWTLERDVRDMLRQSAVMEHLWGVRVTSAMLQAEADRIAEATRIPRRLSELHAALGEDPVLVQEALVRPALVSRLFHEKFDNDPVIQAAPRAEAEAIAAALSAGALDPAAEHPRRRAYDPFSDRPPAELTGEAGAAPSRRTVATGKVVEENAAFVVRVPFQIQGHPMEAEYAVPRVTWDAWWRVNGDRFDTAAQLAVIADGMASLRAPGTGGPSLDGACRPGDVWAQSILSQPGPVAGAHLAVWTGSLYLVFAGPSSLARYDPALDAWMPMSGANAPMGFRAPALWNGTEMDIYGGSVGGSSSNPPPYPGPVLGSRYNPVTDSWTAYSHGIYSVSGHTWIWVGTKAVMRGGRCEPYYDISCEAYPPYTGFPQYYDGGAWGTAVWTGSKAIFYGGYSYFRLGPGPGGYGFGTGNSVTIHDPVSKSWSSIAGDAISGGRYGHRAVWTGSRMLVYGGNYSKRNYDSNFNIVEVHETRNSLVAYDPAVNTWEMMGSLPANAGTSIVWTGQALLSWGGAAGSRFDPVTRLWSAISTVDAPQPRSNPAVGWDGEGMFVHGGFDGSVAKTDGGRYFPHPLTDGDGDADGVSPCQGDCNDTDAAIHPGAAEACNGLDDDCDGARDDGNPGGGAPCGQTDVGECRLGITECSGGSLACVGAVDPADEICNGLDDDCDGASDDGNPGAGASCGLDAGQCVPGLTACESGALSCLGDVGPQPESCNGLDDDCDGEVPAAENDADQDGFASCAGDCDDASSLAHPGAVDMPGNLADENCDGTAVCSPAMAWKNNGAYVLCVVRACVELVDSGRATPHQCLGAIAAAARSHVGLTTTVDPAGDGYEEVMPDGGK
jgi:hypothetical protein